MNHPNSFQVVGIVGRLNSGKGTASQVFIDEGYDDRAFADPLKRILHELFDIPKGVLWGPSENRTGEVRQMLQELGTDFARKFRPDVWIDKMRETIKRSHRQGAPGIVITDVRFINEVEMLREFDATIIHIERPSSGAHETQKANDHPSESESAKIPRGWVTHRILNDGTLAQLRESIRELLQ